MGTLEPVESEREILGSQRKKSVETTGKTVY